MVAKITSPHSIKRALNYNEKKVQQGKAACIHAGNFLKDLDKMNFYHKLGRFENLIALNERTQKSNTLHISLNFDPSEKFDREKLANIAKAYMEKIGFGEQPYLVYQHNDAGYPHIHIVTTNISADGSRINTFNIGRNQSEKARKEIEVEFALVKASSKNKYRSQNIEPVIAQKAQYGKSETKRAITNVLDAVIDKYKYTSLSELNAILKQYNVVADKGIEGGRIEKHKGLLYKMLDSDGNKIGVPVKASSIHSQPTLKNLEKKFAENEIKRQSDKQKLKTAIEWCIGKNPQSIKDFIIGMQKENVQVVLRQNEKGFLYGITFIDHRTKAIFNGSDIGKQYSAPALQERINRSSVDPEKKPEQKITVPDRHPIQENKGLNKEPSHEKAKDISNDKNDLLEILMRAERNESRLPFQLVQKKRKKKRKLGL